MMTPKWKKHLHQKLLASTAIIGGAMIATPQLAGAAPHLLTGSQIATVSITDPDSVVDVTTDPSASITVAAGDALTINGTNAISSVITYTDVNTTSLTSSVANGLSITNSAPAGSVTVDTNGAISGGTFGIHVNGGNGSIDITTLNTVTGTSQHGISAEASSADTVSVTTSADVEGGLNGIYANNDGTGDVEVTVNSGTVTGANIGISARSLSGTGDNDIKVNTTQGTVISTGTGTHTMGIWAYNQTANGSGDVSVTTGDVIGGGYGVGGATNGTGNVDIDTTQGEVTGIFHGVYGRILVDPSNTASSNSVTITTGKVTSGTLGDGISAIHAWNAGTGDVTIDSTGGDVTLYRNADAYAVYGRIANANSTGNIIINTANVTGATGGGIWGSGISAYNDGLGAVTVDSSLGSVTSSARGILAYNSNANNNSDMTVTAKDATGDAGYGVYALNFGTGNTSVTVTNDGLVQGGTSGININAANSTQINLTIHSGSSAQNLSGNTDDSAIQITGGSGKAAIIQNDGTITGTATLDAENASFTNNGIWNAAGGVNDFGGGTDALNISASGMLNAAGTGTPATTSFSNLESVGNAGTITMQNNIVGDSLTFAGGAYTGNAGSLLIDTDIAAGTSDMLNLDSIATNSTTLVNVNITDGLGQDTTSFNGGNGILIVDSGGVSSVNANSFTLQQPLKGGLFTYNLLPGTDPTNAQDFFLRSSYNNAAATTAATPAASWQIVLSMLPKLHDRIAYIDGLIPQETSDKDDRSQASLRPQANVQDVALHANSNDSFLQNAVYNPNNQQAQVQPVALSERSSLQAQQPPARRGVWARILGQNLKFQSHDDAGSGFDGNIWGLQAGLDFYAKVKANGSRQYAGAYLANASSDGDVLNNTGTIGSLDMDATSLGLYYTKYSADGWYLDGIAQYSWLRNIKARTGSETIEPDGSSYTLSLEAGKQLYRDRSVILEPQAQLIYSHNSLDDVTLSDDTVIHIANLNAVTGRFGARVFPNPNRGNSIMPWASANIWHTFSSNSKISSSGVDLQTPIGGTVGELAAGLSTRPGSDGKGWTFNASLGYLFNLGGADYSGLKGSLGIRKNW